MTLKVGVLPIADLAPLYLGNLPLKPLAAGVSGAATEDKAWDALLAPKGGVTGLKQLEGKKVSVNTLKNQPEVAVRNSLEKAGVDVSKVQFVEVPFPDVPAALEAKRVDAAFAVEPFVGSSVATGATKPAEPFEELAPPAAGYAALRRTGEEALELEALVDDMEQLHDVGAETAMRDHLTSVAATLGTTPQPQAARVPLATAGSVWAT